MPDLTIDNTHIKRKDKALKDAERRFPADRAVDLAELQKFAYRHKLTESECNDLIVRSRNKI